MDYMTRRGVLKMIVAIAAVLAVLATARAVDDPGAQQEPPNVRSAVAYGNNGKWMDINKVQHWVMKFDTNKQNEGDIARACGDTDTQKIHHTRVISRVDIGTCKNLSGNPTKHKINVKAEVLALAAAGTEPLPGMAYGNRGRWEFHYGEWWWIMDFDARYPHGHDLRRRCGDTGEQWIHSSLVLGRQPVGYCTDLPGKPAWWRVKVKDRQEIHLTSEFGPHMHFRPEADNNYVMLKEPDVEIRWDEDTSHPDDYAGQPEAK